VPPGLDELRERAQVLATEAKGRPEAARAARLGERLSAGQFLVAVVGEFKRGKSTLVNALLGEEVVPSGVLPLTAVATEIRFGGPTAVVAFQDGSRRTIEPTGLADYATEMANPGNERGVARLEVWGQWPLLEPGVALVDTPGIGSIHRHNTEAGGAALMDADGAVMVLSADTPMSEQERDLLGELADRRAPTFFVLNKADHLSGDDIGQVKRFVDGILSELFGRAVPLFAVDARSSLAARKSGKSKVGEQGVEFDAFVSEFERFVRDDLVGARVATVRAELSRLGASLRAAVSLEQAAVNADAADLARLVERFTNEADRQRLLFEDDCTLLDRDVARLIDEVGQRLSTFAREAPAAYLNSLDHIASAAQGNRLVDELRSGVEAAVRAGFEDFRQAEAVRVEDAWRTIAESFRSRTQQRVDEARVAAAELFAVALPQLTIPTLSTQIERFTYLFLQVGSTLDPVNHLLGRLVPSRLALRRALANARTDLAAEFDKHAGRARWDLSQRLAMLCSDVKKAMRSELDQSIETVDLAAARAQEWQRLAEDERLDRAVATDRLQKVAAGLVAIDGPPE
jgi:small GTP-binding protein